MRKRSAVSAALALCALLSGCGEPSAPAADRDGMSWSGDWTLVGGVLGVEADPGGALVLRENNSALAANDMYYATWSMGEAEPYTNEDGDEADLYDVQVYLLLVGKGSDEEARETVDEWREMAAERYENVAEEEIVYNAQPFSSAVYNYAADTNPYDNGAAAFGVFGNYALNVEVSCRDTFDGSAAEILAGFLERCHYAA